MRKGLEYRLYPTPRPERALEAALDESRWLYHQLLEVRKTAYEQTGKGPSRYEQHARRPAWKAERPSLAGVHSQVLQNVAVRVNLAFKAFFRRVKAGGEKPGFPRFRGRRRYDSLNFPHVPSGCQLLGRRLRLSKIGDVKRVLHRPREGKPNTCIVRRASTGKWYASFSCEIQAPPVLPPVCGVCRRQRGPGSVRRPVHRRADRKPLLLPNRGAGAGEGKSPSEQGSQRDAGTRAEAAHRRPCP